MKKLFLLDAYALVYRAYYAFIKNPRINSKGLNTSAIYGFVNTLEDILKREKPSHIAIAFDPSGKTFRHEAYEAYKAQRESTPEDIRTSLPIIKNIIKAYGIPIIEVPGFEADDVIGTLAKKAEKAGFITYMVTPDKDYGQLVSERIFMYRPKHTGGYETLGIEEIKEKYQLASHEQVIDLLGLMGDSSDNIPGCPGVGEKTAVKLLQEFGSIDNLLAHTEQLKGALKTKVEENKDLIAFSKFLATIRTDVPVELHESELILSEPDENQLRTLYEELEFRTFIAKMQASQASKPETSVTKKAPQQGNLFDMFEENDAEEERTAMGSTSTMDTIDTIKPTYILLNNAKDIDAFVADLLSQKTVCFDTETTGIDINESKLVGMSFCWKKNTAYYIPFTSFDETALFLEKIQPLFNNEHTLLIGQNLKFDLLMLQNYGMSVRAKLFDTMVAHYVLQPELRHGMDYLAEIYLKYRTIHYEDIVGVKGKNQQNIQDIDPAIVCNYAAEDADITFQLKEILEKELHANRLEKLFFDIEMPLVKTLCTIERAGVRIDTQALSQSSLVLTEQMQEIEHNVQQHVGFEFNLSSAKQVGEVLFDRLKITDKAKKTKTGQYATSEDILEELRGKHPIVPLILEYRGLKKLLSTYIDALPLLVNKHSGKIHTSYNQTITATGRLSSSNPNLQNIPIRDAQGKEIRKAFVPDEGCLFLSADYSQIELRIMAHLSQDENMVDAFLSGHDIHAATAAKIYKIPIEEVSSDMRRKAKTANFGIIYGISVFGLSDRLSISRSEAKELIDGYFDTYPGVKSYMEASIAKAKEQGYVETLLGRKRFLPDINSSNSFVRGFAERNAINAPIQGSAADIIKIAMIRITQRFEQENIQSQMTMQVHDELNFSVLKSELEIVKRIVIEEMEHAISLRVPLVADCGVGDNWLEAH